MPESLSHSDAPEPVLLIIADISGYTRYMTANAKTLAHSQTIITELVKSIIQSVQLPLEVAKLEGDAVFLFCRKQAGTQPWGEMKRMIGEKLLTFFRLFSEKLDQLSQSTTCTCNACTHMDQLRLKVVVHSGEALFHHVVNFLELAGVDVIIVHRLLKNSVTVDQYLLVTEAARKDVEFPESIAWVTGSETYDQIGRIQTFVHLPGDLQTPAATLIRGTVCTRFAIASKLFCQLWFSPLTAKPRHQHVTSDANALGRTGLALLTILLTPLFLPVSLAFVFLRTLKPPLMVLRHDHVHKPDGSCCRKV